MHSHTIYEWRVGVICYFTTVGFIDNELVGANPGIDDLTSVLFPCWQGIECPQAWGLPVQS